MFIVKVHHWNRFILERFAELIGTNNLELAAEIADQLIGDLEQAERARKRAIRKQDRLEKQGRAVV